LGPGERGLENPSDTSTHLALNHPVAPESEISRTGRHQLDGRSDLVALGTANLSTTVENQTPIRFRMNDIHGIAVTIAGLSEVAVIHGDKAVRTLGLGVHRPDKGSLAFRTSKQNTSDHAIPSERQQSP
jgi:hypothetical protein